MKTGQDLLNKELYKRYLFILGTIILCLTMTAPAIEISSHLPRIRPEEILLIFCFPILFFLKKLNFQAKTYMVLGFGFCSFILIEIFYQGRSSNLRDYFEVLEVLKYLGFLFISYAILSGDRLINVMKAVFVFLVAFNTLHYFNLFNFNSLIEPLYAPEVHLQFFGLNTLGQPDTKRLLGTLGNPNNNAILFLFFMSFFSAFKLKTHKVFFYTAFVFMLACQSRTALIACLPILIYRWWTLENSKLIIRDMLRMLALAVVFFAFDAAYLAALGDAGKMIQSASVKGRMEVWGELFDMIKQKPFLGHGPDKDFFYDRGMYPESEYILALWRYGVLGFSLFLAFLFFPLYLYLKRDKKDPEKQLGLMFWIVIVITCITNNPLQEPSILLMFAYSTGLLLKAELDNSDEEIITGR